MAAPTKRSQPGTQPLPGIGVGRPEREPGQEGYRAIRHAEEIHRWVEPTRGRRSPGIWRPWVWLLLAALVVGSLVVAGWYVRGNKISPGKYVDLSWWQQALDALKIFPSGFPGYDTDQAVQYNVPRYVAAGVFLLASFRLCGSPSRTV